MLEKSESSPELYKLIVVSLGGIEVSQDQKAVLITYALGSCIAMTAYDPKARLGGMIHYQLPRPVIKESLKKPRLAYGCYAIPLLLEKMCKSGAQQNRLVVKIAGGAQKFPGNRLFRIGRQNIEIAEQILVKNDIPLAAKDVGGVHGRNMALRIKDGLTTINNPSQGEFELK